MSAQSSDTCALDETQREPKSLHSECTVHRVTMQQLQVNIGDENVTLFSLTVY